MIDPATCAHPLHAVVPDPDKPDKSRCLLCGVTGTIMTKTAAGILVPKALNGKGRG